MITDINSEDHLVQQTFAAHLEKVLVRRLRRCLSIPSPLLWGPKPTGGSSRDLSAATPPRANRRKGILQNRNLFLKHKA